jgi:lysophospholipase L1-like esterase
MLRGGFEKFFSVGAVVAAALMTAIPSAVPAEAQSAQAATSSAYATAPSSSGIPAAGAQVTLQDKGIAGKTVDKVKEVAKQAGDIFSRVPCLPPKGGVRPLGSLPHVANKLIDGAPVVIVAFGSSSTQGHGSTSPAFNYPNRLAAQLKRTYPTADITVINRGQGGEDAPEMMARLKNSVLDLKPDMVIWQVGTNAILRNLDPAETAKLVEEGISLIQTAGADLVLVDPQYAPRVNERAENAGKMINLLGRVAEIRKVGIFPRFEVMRDWHERQALPFDNFVTADGLHMNDWGYACFAQLLGDDIIRSVGQIRLGIHVPSDVHAYRPM